MLRGRRLILGHGVGRGTGSGAGAGSAMSGLPAACAEAAAEAPTARHERFAPMPCCVAGGGGTGLMRRRRRERRGPGRAPGSSGGARERAASREAEAAASVGDAGCDEDGGGGGGAACGAVRPSSVAFAFAAAGGGVPAAGMGAGVRPGDAARLVAPCRRCGSPRPRRPSPCRPRASDWARWRRRSRARRGDGCCGLRQPRQLGGGAALALRWGGGATTGGNEPRPGGGGGVRGRLRTAAEGGEPRVGRLVRRGHAEQRALRSGPAARRGRRRGRWRRCGSWAEAGDATGRAGRALLAQALENIEVRAAPCRSALPCCPSPAPAARCCSRYHDQGPRSLGGVRERAPHVLRDLLAGS